MNGLNPFLQVPAWHSLVTGHAALSIWKEKLEWKVQIPQARMESLESQPRHQGQRDEWPTHMDKGMTGTYVWVSSWRPQKQHLPRESREALQRLCLEEGKAGAGGVLIAGAPEPCLWEAFVAPAVQHLHGINGGYFRR